MGVLKPPYQIRALVDFKSEELGSEYCAGLIYTVGEPVALGPEYAGVKERTRRLHSGEALAEMAPKWIQEGVAELFEHAAKVAGTATVTDATPEEG